MSVWSSIIRYLFDFQRAVGLTVCAEGGAHLVRFEEGEFEGGRYEPDFLHHLYSCPSLILHGCLQADKTGGATHMDISEITIPHD